MQKTSVAHYELWTTIKKKTTKKTKSAKVIKSQFAKNICKANTGKQGGRGTKESQASYWRILVNYPNNEKQKQELAN